MAFRLITQRQLDEYMRKADPAPPQSYLDVIVPVIEESVESFLNRPLEYKTNTVEWCSPSDDTEILLSRRPVASIAEVRVDSQGGFGQRPNSFGTGSIQVAGEDYFLLLDGTGIYEGMSESGVVVRGGGRTWGFTRGYQSGLLSPAKQLNPGSVKVTYTGGYQISDNPTDNRMPGVIGAAIAQLASVWFQSLTNIGVVTGESVPNYSYQQILGFNLGDNQFASVRQMLAKYRSMRPGVSPG